MTATERVISAHKAISGVPCPSCRAAAGERCRTPKGHLADLPHAPRREAATAAGLYVPGEAS